jgi:hypothetical protein
MPRKKNKRTLMRNRKRKRRSRSKQRGGDDRGVVHTFENPLSESKINKSDDEDIMARVRGLRNNKYIEKLLDRENYLSEYTAPDNWILGAEGGTDKRIVEWLDLYNEINTEDIETYGLDAYHPAINEVRKSQENMYAFSNVLTFYAACKFYSYVDEIHALCKLINIPIFDIDEESLNRGKKWCSKHSNTYPSGSVGRRVLGYSLKDGSEDLPIELVDLESSGEKIQKIIDDYDKIYREAEDIEFREKKVEKKVEKNELVRKYVEIYLQCVNVLKDRSTKVHMLWKVIDTNLNDFKTFLRKKGYNVEERRGFVPDGSKRNIRKAIIAAGPALKVVGKVAIGGGMVGLVYYVYSTITAAEAWRRTRR